MTLIYVSFYKELSLLQLLEGILLDATDRIVDAFFSHINSISLNFNIQQ